MTTNQFQVCCDALKAQSLLDETALIELGRITFRRGVGRPPGIDPDRYAYAKDWDWTKSNTDLSREHGTTIATIRNIRERLAKPPGVSTFKAAVRAERQAWNWCLSDAELARQHSVSRERIRQIRAELGMPSSPERRKQFDSDAKALFLLWVNGRKSIRQVDAVKAGHHADRIRRWCREEGILRERLTYKGKYPWEQFNWELPNWALSKVWQTPTGVVGSRRMTGNHGPAPRIRVSEATETLQSLLAAEQVKADAWRAKLAADAQAAVAAGKST